MRFSLMIVALLCVTALLSLAHASTHGRVSSCCHQYSNTRVTLEKLSHYRHQEEGVCPIKAVVFHTTRGRRICSDPNNSWAKRMISTLDQRQASKMMGNKEESANTITPTVSAVSERFQTSLNKQVGSDPDSSWTTTGILNTDKEPHMLQMKGNNEGISTTTIAPIVSSTSKSKPKKKGRGRKTRLRKSRSGRRWMKKVNIVVEISEPH